MKIDLYYKVLSLAVLSALYANNSYALTTLTDTNFPASTVAATSDNITINTTTNGALTPQINTTTGDGLSVSNSQQMIVNSSNIFGITSNAAGNYNSFYGIRVIGGGVFTANSDIDIKFNAGSGVYIASQGNAIFNNKLNIESSGLSSIGIRGYSSSVEGSNSEFKDEVTIVANGGSSYGIFSQVANNPDQNAPSMTFDKNVSITMNAPNSIGVIATGTLLNNPGLIYFKDGLDINMASGVGLVSELDNHTIKADGDIRVVANNANSSVIEATAGTVELNGQAYLEGDSYAVDTGKINLNLSKSSQVIGNIYAQQSGLINMNLSGNSTMAGDIEASDEGVMNLNLSGNAKVTGKMDNYANPNNSAGVSAGKIAVNFADGSSWTMTDSSSINSLAGQGNIIFDNYTTGMLLSITDANGATGNHTVEVVDSGNNAGDAANGATIITTKGGSATFSMPNLANIGAYQYGITQAGNDWQLERKESFSLTTNNAINGLRAGYLMNYNENQSLLQRMGELRQSASEGDLWVKLLAGKNKVDGNSQLSGFDQKFYGMQVGADRKYILNENANAYLGLAFGYTHSDQNYERGDGNIDSYYINAYGTYTNVNGFYVDNVFKLGRQKQDFSLQDNQNNSVYGDTNSTVVGLSSELGYKYYFLEQQKTGWFTEPSAQLSYSRVASDSFTASNGQHISFDSYSSMLGKVGVMVGYDFSQAENPANLYVKTNYFHEFDGDLDGKINDESIKTDLGSNWWSYGVGFNMQIENLHNVYFDIEQSRGADFKQLWKLNVGYRYTW
ncbi:outer membrane autotransporter protein [Orbus hercynius]|uniref:Outer membrane autotransporter protein n=1 Tax=Orbus hercynius TaxID=593135 RepID=A0A495RB01_9GAMM|nr:autotransporter outer membrane beta-barrel domain-containing protein [Orbus hercynius]RKS84511.1 outer membrane autotransporter protein [Orbus hercynius]